MTKRRISTLKVIKATVSEFMEDKALRLAAALAYYAIFSIGPLLVLIIGVAGLVMGEDAVRKQVHELLNGLVGGKSAAAAESMMQSKGGGGSLVATIVGGVALLFGASGVFGQLQDALNTIWEVKPKPGQGIWGFVRQRFLSMTMVLGIGFLLLVSMVLTTIVNSLSNYVGGLVSFSGPLLQGLNFLASSAVITVLFAAIFKVLPDVKIRWRDVWVGAIGTALLFTLGKFLLGLYLGRETTSSAYGAGSAFVVVIMYIYYASLILFLGAEFTQVWLKERGAVIHPSEHAVKVTEDERAQQGLPKDRPMDARARGSRQPGSADPKPAFALAQTKHNMAIQSDYKVGPHTRVSKPPMQQIQQRPWSFVTMAVGAAMAAGVLLKFKKARQLLKWYVLAKRII